MKAANSHDSSAALAFAKGSRGNRSGQTIYATRSVDGPCTVQVRCLSPAVQADPDRSGGEAGQPFGQLLVHWRASYFIYTEQNNTKLAC